MRTLALESFKILNIFSPAYLNDLLTFKNHSYNLRYQRTVEVPQVRTVEHGSRSFRSTAAKNLEFSSSASPWYQQFWCLQKPNKCMERGVLFMFILFCRLKCFYLLVYLVAKVLC